MTVLQRKLQVGVMCIHQTSVREDGRSVDQRICHSTRIIDIVSPSSSPSGPIYMSQGVQ